MDRTSEKDRGGSYAGMIEERYVRIVAMEKGLRAGSSIFRSITN